MDVEYHPLVLASAVMEETAWFQRALVAEERMDQERMVQERRGQENEIKWISWEQSQSSRCQLRLSYLPTPQAALQVERRRTLAASRRCRASRASASSTTAGPVTANMAGGSPQAPTGDLSEVVAVVNVVARQLESQSAEFRRLNEALAPEGYLSAYSDVDDEHDWELW